MVSQFSPRFSITITAEPHHPKKSKKHIKKRKGEESSLEENMSHEAKISFLQALHVLE